MGLLARNEADALKRAAKAAIAESQEARAGSRFAAFSQDAKELPTLGSSIRANIDNLKGDGYSSGFGEFSQRANQIAVQAESQRANQIAVQAEIKTRVEANIAANRIARGADPLPVDNY